MTGDVEALAVYGSLAPGEKNHWVLSRINGTWKSGTVRGHTFEITWGPAEGYDGFMPDPDGSDVEVHVLESVDLHKNWRDIDDFEGSGYERVWIDVALTGGLTRQANIYVALADV